MLHSEAMPLPPVHQLYARFVKDARVTEMVSNVGLSESSDNAIPYPIPPFLHASTDDCDVDTCSDEEDWPNQFPLHGNKSEISQEEYDTDADEEDGDKHIVMRCGLRLPRERIELPSTP